MTDRVFTLPLGPVEKSFPFSLYPMRIFALAAQIAVALSIFNVWMIRFSQPSPWRGGDAQTMKEEFAVYGLSPIILYTVGVAKLLLASLLLAGVLLPDLTAPAAFGLGAFMLGAVAFHVKAGDPITKSLPAGTLLVLCVLVGVLS